MNGHKGLRVYQLAYDLAVEIFHLSKKFPRDERYSLTVQIRRSSRSVAANIAEGYRKRQYPKVFVNKLLDSDSEVAETQTWLDFSLDCGYILAETHKDLTSRYESVGRMIGNMVRYPEKFIPRRVQNRPIGNLTTENRFPHTADSLPPTIDDRSAANSKGEK
jgi:four helix bundle protein